MGSTILVADDDRAIRTVLNQALARLGHDVRMTGNAATLWRWVADGEGDLVITDVIMPDENGLDLIPRIKKIRAEHGALRTGARRHIVSRRDRRHADRCPDPVVACPSGGRVHRRRGPCADP